MSTPKLYRPTLQKQPKTAKGYVAAMTDKPHPSDSDWSGSEYREWVKWADYASAIAAKDVEIAGLRTALDRLLCATEGHDVCPYAKAEARYVLTPETK